MLCPKCGQQNLDDARFCKNCGAPLEAAPPTPPPTAAAPGRSPLEGLGSPSEAPPAAQTSFTAPAAKAPESKAEPIAAPPKPIAPPAEAKTVVSPPPPPPPPVATPVEKKADTSPPSTAAPVETKTAESPPPPSTVEQTAPVQKKSQRKPIIVCLSIVGIVFLLFMLLVIAAMCIGNTQRSYLSGPGDSYIFTIDVSEPVEVAFEVPNNVQFNVTITGPQGDFVGDWTIGPGNNVFTLQRNGTYTLNVYSVYGTGWWKAKW
jgi:hypothetical protein